MVILTSLSPSQGSEVRQKRALESWREAGFQAVSLNPETEVDAISGTYHGLIKVVPTRFLSSHGAGRRLVAVADLIDQSYRRNQGAALILNADIILTPAAIRHFRPDATGVTMIPRWEVDDWPSHTEWELNPWGYDGALLGRELAGVFRNPAFGLGLPWWDYWLPFRALHLGIGVQIIGDPLAFHVRHKEIWDERDRARLAGSMWREVGVPPWKRLWRKQFGPKKERKIYGYHNHLAGHVRELIKNTARVIHLEVSS